MGYEFLVIAEIYLRVLAGGEEQERHLGSLYHQQPFVNLEQCQRFGEGREDSVVQFVDESARTWWSRKLDVDRDSLRIEFFARCFETPS